MLQASEVTKTHPDGRFRNFCAKDLTAVICIQYPSEKEATGVYAVNRIGESTFKPSRAAEGRTGRPRAAGPHRPACHTPLPGPQAPARS